MSSENEIAKKPQKSQKPRPREESKAKDANQSYYEQIPAIEWNHPGFLALSTLARYVWLYLRCGPHHSGITGIWGLRRDLSKSVLVAKMEDPGISSTEIASAFDEIVSLQGDKQLVVHGDKLLLLLPEMRFRDRPTSPKHLTNHMVTSWNMIPESSTKAEIRNMLFRHWCQQPGEDRTLLKKEFLRKMGAPSQNSSSTPSDDVESPESPDREPAAESHEFQEHKELQHESQEIAKRYMTEVGSSNDKADAGVAAIFAILKKARKSGSLDNVLDQMEIAVSRAVNYYKGCEARLRPGVKSFFLKGTWKEFLGEEVSDSMPSMLTPTAEEKAIREKYFNIFPKAREHVSNEEGDYQAIRDSIRKGWTLGLVAEAMIGYADTTKTHDHAKTCSAFFRQDYFQSAPSASVVNRHQAAG